MKKLSVIILLCLCAAMPAAAQGIDFLEQPKWAEVLKTAAKQDKMIFMDCYTTWCGPCKALSEKVFPQPEVGEFFNANFINVKYDMEKGEGVELHKRYKPFIIGFPTLLLIDKEGNVIHQMAGYHEPDALIAGMKAGMEGKSLFAFRARYDAGDRDVDFLTEYISVLNGAFLKDDIEKVAVDYMESLPLDSLLTPANWALVGDYVKDPYSPQFEYVLRNTTQLIYKLKVDGYKLERQLAGALERAVSNIVDLQTDKEGNVLPLIDDQSKIAKLWELIDIANLKRAETQRAFLTVHELKLAGEWQQALDHMEQYSRIKALGYSPRFITETILHITGKTSDKVILGQCLAKMESIQQSEDSSKRGSNYHNVLAALYGALGNDAKAAQSQAIYDEHRAKIKAEWEAMLNNLEE